MPKTKTAVKQTKTGASGSRKTIQEYLGVPNGVKFIERPRETLFMQLQRRDVRGAIINNPQECALARCGKRMFGSSAAAVFSRVAYFVLKNKKGEPYIGKFQGTADTLRKIRAFDATGEMPEGAIEFRPIAETHTRKARLKYHREGPAKVLGPRAVKPVRSTGLRAVPRLAFVRPRGRPAKAAVVGV